MIFDRLENLSKYGLPELVVKSTLDFVSKYNDYPVGKHDIVGKQIYAVVSSYNTQPASEREVESHQRYVDIQIIISGKENIGIVNVEGLTGKGYSAERDIEFFNVTGDVPMTIATGEFMVLYPWEGHRPNCACGDVSKVSKVVIKVDKALLGL